MSSLNQNSVEDLLNKMQQDANGIAANATSHAAAAINSVANDINEIAGEMEAPPVPGARAAPALPTSADFNESFEIPPAFSPLANSDLHRLLAIEVPVIVQMGLRRMSVGEVMRLGVGVIVEFGKSAEEELELLANNKTIGKGHAVKVGENFGIKVSKIGSAKDIIRKLGGI